VKTWVWMRELVVCAELEVGRIREQLVRGVEQRQVGCGEGGGLLVDYDAHGCVRGCRQCAGTSDGSGLLRGGLGSGQPQWHRAVGVVSLEVWKRVWVGS
jgi:hypothetical protein